ncbi:MAG: tRNA lysidine(34) synthetase TilS [Alphaproteobacteria bacterium]|nr:tRNA lysidine(34) synthetase TilS [Alphaproteobacteria bacterium]
MIENFNDNFREICLNLKIDKRRFILGLSGGTDSMALLSLLKHFIVSNKNFKIEVFPVIIDHDLRLNSSNEAKAVQNIALSLGFKTIIKKIITKKPNGNIQNWARKERRRILCDIAFEFSANLILGHHSDDLVETIFMRSVKGSGIEGLRGMQDRMIWNDTLILRPLIFFNKRQITDYVNSNNVIFFEDQSNFLLKFERTRVRETLKRISVSNWPTISNDIIKFSLLNKQLLLKINKIFSKWVQNNILIDNRGAMRVDFKNLQNIFEKSNLFTISIFGRIIKTVGGKEYAPKREKTLNCLKQIFSIWVHNNILIDNRGAIRVDFKNLQNIFEKSNLFTISVFGRIIKTVGGNEYAPKREKTLNCLKRIFSPVFKNTNLGNVKISLKKSYLFFTRENRNINFDIEIIKNKKYIFDGRFFLTSKYSGNLISSEFHNFESVKNDNPFAECENDINITIPFMSTLEGTTIKPYFNMYDGKSHIKTNSESNSYELSLIRTTFM